MQHFVRVIIRTCLAVLLGALVLSGVVAIGGGTSAQTPDLSGLLTPEQQQILRQLGQSGALSNAGQPSNELTQTQQPLATPAPQTGMVPGFLPALPQIQTERPPSRIEEIYSERADADLRQFGYDIFNQPLPTSIPLTGAIQDDYILGVGDEIVVTFRGQRTGTERYPVDREGRVVIQGLRPITAAGRSFVDFRRALEAEAEASLLETEVFVSLGALRRVAVAVMGEVEAPGIQQLSSLSSVLDALVMAGGVTPTGSLRRLQIMRGGQVLSIDLYDLLLGRGAPDLRVVDGDRILVPLIGETVAVTGFVKRPAIYELGPDQSGILAPELVELAGGPWIRGDYRWMLYQIRPNGTEALVEIKEGAGTTVRAGEILALQRKAERQRGTVELVGHVRRPGHYSLNAVSSVAALVGSADRLLPDPYLPFAVLETTDPATRNRVFQPVHLGRVLRGEVDVPLADDDRLIVLGLDDVRFLSSHDVLAILSGQEIVWSSELDVVRAQMMRDAGQMANGQNGPNGPVLPGQSGAAAAAMGRGQLEQEMPPNILPRGQNRLANGARADLVEDRQSGRTDRTPSGLPRAMAEGGRRGDLSGLDEEEAARLAAIREQNRRNLQTLLNPDQVLADDSCTSLVALARARSAGLDDNVFNDQLYRAAQFLEGPVLPCPEVFELAPRLLPFALRNAVLLTSGVLQPGLYPAASGTSAAELVRIAGGSLSARESGDASLAHYAPSPAIQAGAMVAPDQAVMVPDQAPLAPGGAGQAITPGDILAGPGRIIRIEQDRVHLVGHVRFPGPRRLASARTIQDLLPDAEVLRAEPYLLFGAVARLNEITMSRELFPFSPLSVLQGRENFALAPEDVVILFGAADITAFSNVLQEAEDKYQNLLRSQQKKEDPLEREILLRERLRRAEAGLPPLPEPEEELDPAILPSPVTAPGFALDILRRADLQEEPIPFPALVDLAPDQQGLVDVPELRRFVIEYAVRLNGHVRRPGYYPVVPGTPLSLAVAAAGGLTFDADVGTVEYTSFLTQEGVPAQRQVMNLMQVNLAAITLRPKDVARFQPLYTQEEIGSVRVAGEVRWPGDYQILRGERLSSLLTRAGGLTEQAYPQGAVFTRTHTRLAEKENFERAALEIEQQVMAVATREDVPAAEVQAARALAQQLRAAEPLGRVTVIADLAELAARPDLDPLLEAGDAIFIPRRPITVAVSGEVLAPISLTFDADKDVEDYVEDAGGTTRFADEDRIFVLLPNGEARPAEESFWTFRDRVIPPGSTIVVPRNPRPFDWLELTTTTTAILARLATTAASLAVIAR